MAEIKSFLFMRHLRAEPTSHILFFRAGTLRASGRGLALWFSPLGASIAQIPLDDRELPFLFAGRSSDFQDVVVNGVVTFRVNNPELLASRVDFSIDTRTGAYNKEPLDKLALAVKELSQQLASTFLNRAPLKEILDQGIEVIRDAIHIGLVSDEGIRSLGLEIVATRISSVKPTSEMEKALQMPTRERIQQMADEATFSRRALAVDKERAIQENELGNQIELAKREEQLIAQRGQNERKRATETAESKRIEAEAAAKNVLMNAQSQAQGITVLEEAKVHAEADRMEIYRNLPSAALMGLAARELAGKLQTIEHLTLSPDMLGSLLQRVLGAQANKLEHDAE
ncbi:MAG TPA: SPFH domain-containing protein [Myxococcota bacterium]|jgi:regulator of protease activity HflC (stomatin/prohibitin superfamily)